MIDVSRLLRIALPGIVLLACAAPAQAQRPGRSRLTVGVGIGRIFPERPLAQAPGMPDYTLAAAAATSVSIDYWWRHWLGTRLSYQWVRTNVEKPSVASFGRINTVYGAVLLAPLQIPLRRPPFLVLGGGVRRYDINSQLSSGGAFWDIAPRQNRPAAYAGVGAGFRIGPIDITPEAGVWANTFRHEYRCAGCTDSANQLDLVLTLHLVFGG